MSARVPAKPLCVMLIGPALPAHWPALGSLLTGRAETRPQTGRDSAHLPDPWGSAPHPGRGAQAPLHPASGQGPVVGLPSSSFQHTVALPRGRAGLVAVHVGHTNRRHGPAAPPSGAGVSTGPVAGRPSPGACRCQGCASPPQKNFIFFDWGHSSTQTLNPKLRCVPVPLWVEFFCSGP